MLVMIICYCKDVSAIPISLSNYNCSMARNMKKGVLQDIHVTCRHVWCRGKASALRSKRHEFEPSSRHKSYTQCAVGVGQ